METLHGPHWTELIPGPTSNALETDLSSLPVVKLAYSDGREEHALVSPTMIDLRDRRTLLTQLFVDLAEIPTGKLWTVPVEILKQGVFKDGVLDITVHFDGFVHDESHSGRHWTGLS